MNSGASDTTPRPRVTIRGGWGRVRAFGARLFEFAALNVLSQGIGFLAGILVVRELSKTDYAHFTISVSIATAASVVSGTGIASVLLARTGAAGWTLDSRGEEVSGALAARRRMLALVGPIGLAALIALLMNAGATVGEALVSAGLVGVVLTATLHTELAAVTLSFSNAQRAMQMVRLGANGCRLALYGLLAFLGAGSGVAFLAALALVALLESRFMRWQSQRHVPLPSTLDSMGVRAPYFLAVRQSIVASLFVIIGEQAIIATLTFAGQVEAIAEIAALAKFEVVFTVVNAAIISLVAPIVSRRSATRGVLVRTTLLLSTAYFVLASGYILVMIFAGDLVLRVLGPQYVGLNPQLVVVACGSALANFTLYSLGAVNYARGWQRLSWLYGPLLAVWLVSGVLWIDLDSDLGPAIFKATSVVPLLVSHLIRFGAGLYRSEAPRD